MLRVNIPQSCDMGQTALLPLRRKACCGFFSPKNPTASAGFVRSGIRPYVTGQLVIDHSSQSRVLTFACRNVQYHSPWTFGPVKVRTAGYLETSGSDYTQRQRHILGEWTPHLYRCESHRLHPRVVQPWNIRVDQQFLAVGLARNTLT
jgi:hypothetical protein